jgi:protein gp37
MADTSIEWTDKTWNPVVGCTKVSQGCKNCYAKMLHDKRHKAYQEHGGIFPANGRPIPAQYAEPFETVQLKPERLLDPLRWRKPARVFVNSVSDLFHPDVPDEFIDEVFAVMAIAKQHTFQILTKRPERMAVYLNYRWRVDHIYAQWYGFSDQPAELQGWPLPNVWLGTSVENQEAGDKRIPHLLETPAAVRFLSCEPLLGPVQLFNVGGWENAAHWWGRNIKLDWVIVGGESGPGARPMHPDWARSLRDQCSSAGVPFFYKQHGEYLADDRQFVSFQTWVDKASSWVQGATCMDKQGRVLKRGADFQEASFPVTLMRRVGKKRAGRLLDGREHNEFPEVVG